MSEHEPGGVPGEDVTWGEYILGPLVPADVEELAAAHARIWRETYVTLMDPGVLGRIRPDSFLHNWTERAQRLQQGETLPNGERILIARFRGAPVAFLSVGNAREEDPPVDHQLWALNVLPEHQGTGLAQHMMSLALGDRDAYLWVAEGNDRALAFYRGQGFTTDGARQSRGDGMTEIRMVRRAAA